tara:strand:+ start:178 stop:333 length:156 start_codon:yes stop_codon:yes gene_type:complete
MGLGIWQNFGAIKLGGCGCCSDGAIVYVVYGVDDVGRDRCGGWRSRSQGAR